MHNAYCLYIPNIHAYVNMYFYDLFVLPCSSTQQELRGHDAGRDPDAIWHGHRSPGTPGVVSTSTVLSRSDNQPATWWIHHATAASVSAAGNA